MKIYLNRQPKYGPWGGGAKTVNMLDSYLRSKGHEVVYVLQGGIDLLFCFDPRPNNYGENYYHLLQYKQIYNTKIIQRVGDVGTHGKPDLTNLVKYGLDKSDYFIFPSDWARQQVGFDKSNFKIVHNAPMSEFYSNRSNNSALTGVPTIVTHHWSTNVKKGFQFYQEFDDFCHKTGKFKFHYIGQLPNNCAIRSRTDPLGVPDLIKILPSFDIYLTASEEEAGANHVLEAMASGLPVVYRSNGGSIVEYCKPYGISYNNFSEMVSSVENMVSEYNTYRNKVNQYDDNIEKVVLKYYNIIQEVLNEG